MSERIPPPGTPSILAPETLRAVNATSLPASTSASASTTTSTSFAEAQRRLADLRRQRAAADAQRRAHDAAAATAQRESAAAARRARLTTSTPSLFAPAASLARISNSALVAWDGVTQAASTISSKLGGGGGGGDGASSSSTALGSRPAFRVSQVDAELLDEELLELLRSQVADALQYVRGGTLQDDWQPEVMLVLRAALFKLSVWDNNATYGAALQNLRYADARGAATAKGAPAVREAVPIAPSKWQKSLYGLATVGGRYAWTKWEDWLRDNDSAGDDEEEDDDYDEGARASSSSQTRTLLGRINVTPQAMRRLARVTSTVSNLYAGAACVSFLVFLRYGRYRTLLDRALRMRLVPPTSQVSREVSFEYLNRQLVWHAFTEFLLFLLPLIGIHRWRRWLTRVWRRTKGVAARAVSTIKRTAALEGTDNTDTDGAAEKTKTGELAFLPERTCAICYQDQNQATSEADMMAAAAASSGVIGSAETDITNPYEAIPCGCVYCYVSIATRIEREEGDGWTCLRCGTLVTACKPWSGDVLEPASASEAAAAAARDDVGASGVLLGAHDSRPSSSSTNASGGSPHAQKTVGFAADVKGDDVDTYDTASSHGEITIHEMEDESDEQMDVLDKGNGDDEGDEVNSGSEAYEEDEDAVEGDGDGDDAMEE